MIYISADILPVEQQILVGRPYKISCPIFASSELNSTFIWIGPNGVITGDGRQTIVTDIANDNTTSTSNLHFSYLREDDEGSYRCDLIVFGYNYNYSTSSSVELTNFTGTYLSRCYLYTNYYRAIFFYCVKLTASLYHFITFLTDSSLL